METPKHFALPQNGEIPAFYEQVGRFHYRIAYSRSADSRNNDETGQDYLSFATNGQRFAFALCDGVSQSFYGDVAAKILGNKLLGWAWLLDFRKQRDSIWENLSDELTTLIAEASLLVRDHPIPGQVPPMVRAVLDKKRTLGSESTFIAGVIDYPGEIAGFVWMGDSRLRLWQSDKELLGPFEGLFKTSERWSTIKGPVGELHLVYVPLSDFDHLAVYSDGFSFLDAAYRIAGAAHPFSNHAIDAFIADAALRPSSDDISFLEVWMTPTPPQFPKVSENLVISGAQYEYRNETHSLSWEPVVGATEYEIRLSAENKTTLSSTKVSGREWHNNGELDANARFISVRPWYYQEPGDWSDFTPIKLVAPPTPAQLVNMPRSQTGPLTEQTGSQASLPPNNQQISANRLPQDGISQSPLSGYSNGQTGPTFASPPKVGTHTQIPPTNGGTISTVIPGIEQPAKPTRRSISFWLRGVSGVFLIACLCLIAFVFVSPDISSQLVSILGLGTPTSIASVPTASAEKTKRPVQKETNGPTAYPNEKLPIAPALPVITSTTTSNSDAPVSTILECYPNNQLRKYPSLNHKYTPVPSAYTTNLGETVTILKGYNASYNAQQGDGYSTPDWYFVRTSDNSEGWLLGMCLKVEDINNANIPFFGLEIFSTPATNP